MKLFTQAFAPIETNSYLLIDLISCEAVWIDPAPGSGSWADENLPQSCHLKAIVCTHSHWDHIAAVGEMKRFENTPFFVHALDAANLTQPGSDRLPWPQGIRKPTVSSLKTFEEGDRWQLGSSSFEVWHTPGHSPGSCCFFNREQAWLFSGDTLFAFGYGRCDLPTGSPQTMRTSLHRLHALHEEVMIFPGHGPRSLRKNMTWLDEIVGHSDYKVR